ncbi:T9SS type B sorting domain-containing protein [Chryseobacterium sp.]|uniref:T9SS type B sorting domain-containing protein n=1 Tax=Chryseobacterium sp. TaxID=1871047 RepID=UPI00388EBFC7
MKKYLLVFILCLSQIFLAQSSSDCGATTVQVCGNSPISFTPTGPGDTLETLGGCLSGEHFSVWYTFNIATSGTLTFNINPNDLSDDYDWAVYGPNKTCANLGSPIRCNYSAADGPTGLNMTSTLTSATATQSPFCSYMNVVAGETYYLIVDNFSSSANGFVLTWGGTAQLVSPFNSAYQPNPFIAPGDPGPTPTSPREVIVCSDPAVFDFSTLSAGIINNNPNFIVNYHYNPNDAINGNNPINTPIPVNTTDTYYYAIMYNDPAAPSGAINRCRIPGTFKFVQHALTVNNATLTACNNNDIGTAVFNLSDAIVTANTNVVYKYFPTMNDAIAGTNEITNPFQYTSAGGTVYVKVTSQYGCVDIAEIKLTFYAPIVVTDAILRSCFIDTNPSTGLFDLTTANVTLQGGTTKQYFPSEADAVNNTNEIQSPANHIAPTGVAFVRVNDANGCFNVAKVNLYVIPPIYSTVLEDKIICIENTTTLDAGPGFDGYLWSTGATTQSVFNIGVGTYWVQLKSGNCTSMQKVTVYPSEQPVITYIDVTTSTITVNVVGGTPSYKYSLDDIVWQDSNVFNNLTRGDYTVYVKDAYNCIPIQIGIAIPNLVNVITPNGDGINDVINYSSFANSHNLIMDIFDRYGTKIHRADKSNGYTWDGTIAGKKVATGNYWYSVTWNENNKNKTSMKYSGWIMVKNRE